MGMRQVMYSDGTPSREVEDDDGRPHALDLLVAQKKRIAELEVALRPFAAVAGVGVSRMKIDPTLDRLWSYYDSRAEHQHEITRAHVNEAARVLKLQS